jgi:hypothetical protein
MSKCLKIRTSGRVQKKVSHFHGNLKILPSYNMLVGFREKIAMSGRYCGLTDSHPDHQYIIHLIQRSFPVVEDSFQFGFLFGKFKF